MNCEMARNHMLEADLPALRSEGESDLARHLRGCHSCQVLARRILDQTAALAAGLEHLNPPRPDLVRLRRAVPGALARRWAIAVPLALAASMVVLVLNRRPRSQAPASDIPSQLVTAAAPLDVQVPRGQTFTVFQTENPNIVVVWSF